MARDRGHPDVTLRTDDLSAVARLDMVVGNPLSGVKRLAATDMMLRLKPWGDVALQRALSEANASAAVPGGNRIRFTVEVIIAAGGRIFSDERATCGPWSGDVSVCRTECDGGAFALARRGGGTDFVLQAGPVPAVRDAGFGDAIRLGACSDVSPEARLTVRGGGAVSVSLARQ